MAAAAADNDNGRRELFVARALVGSAERDGARASRFLYTILTSDTDEAGVCDSSSSSSILYLVRRANYN